jgi:hypothetical protein
MDGIVVPCLERAQVFEPRSEFGLAPLTLNDPATWERVGLDTVVQERAA